MQSSTNVIAAATASGGSACGKVILLGEHAVEYGVPALAAGIERGVRATATPGVGKSSLTVLPWRTMVTEDDPTDLGRALRALVEASSPRSPLAIEATVDLARGSGMGCSAALGIAVARTIDPHATASEIMVRAMAWEEVFHLNPSGLDAAVASRGGCLLFSKGQGIETLRVGASLTLCIGHSGERSSTDAMVAKMAARRRERRSEVDAACEGIRDLVASSRFAIHTGDRCALGRLMSSNQIWLAELGLSTPAIDRMCRLARAHGAFGAKLTGAGGGGSVVALVNGGHGAWQVLHAWRGAGFEGFVTRVAPAQSHVDALELHTHDTRIPNGIAARGD
jgi:mevalonate kinase